MFDKKELARWVNYNLLDGGVWQGTESNRLIKPILGAPFPADYPFKMTLISHDAPVYEDKALYFQPETLDVKVKIAIQAGKVFDLSKINNFKKNPLLVSKMRDGTYKIINTQGVRRVEESELEDYAVPVFINGKLMKKIDWTDQDSVDQATLEITVRFRNNFPVVENDLDLSQIVMVVETQAFNEDRFSPITRVEIMSGKQIKDKGGASGFQSPFLKNKTVIPFFTGWLNSSFQAIDSPFYQLQYKPILNRRLSQVAQDQTKDRVYIHVFQINSQGSFNIGENFNDHILIRI